MLTGQCYCGATTISATARPSKITYCHCVDCRRATGAPVAVFAAFNEGDVTFSPDEGKRVSIVEGATRSFCTGCGSLLSGRYEYLPGQVYLGVGLLDEADKLIPECHAHEGARLEWLHIEDDLPRFDASARSHLTSAGQD